MKGRLTYIELGAEEVPIVQASLRSDLLFEQRWQVLVYRKVLVQLVHHLLEDNQVVSEDEARQEPLRILLVKQYYLALVNGIYCGRGPDHTCLQKTIEHIEQYYVEADSPWKSSPENFPIKNNRSRTLDSAEAEMQEARSDFSVPNHNFKPLYNFKI